MRGRSEQKDGCDGGAASEQINRSGPGHGEQ